MNNYSDQVTDQTNVPAGSNFPDVSTDAGNTYPIEYYDLLPSLVVPTMQSNGDGMGSPLGDWSTPQAYSWHSSDMLTTNPEIGGSAGHILTTSFAMGQVESNTVENFEMLGSQAVFQAPNVMNWGDVGYNNASGILAASVASSYYDEQPFEDWASSIIGGV
jgi:hypothetical protein